MKPAFSYYGGKQKMVKNLLPLIPRHSVYVEPFAGGAALFFAKPLPNTGNSNDYREVLNDKDSRISNFYHVLKTQPDALAAACEATLHSREAHGLAKYDQGDSVERARRFFVLVCQSYGHQPGRGWRYAKLKENDGVTFNAKKNALRACGERLSQIYVEHDDAIDVIKRWDSPQTFFYCDPPYVGTNQGHYAGYTQADLDALIATLQACKGSFLLSGYNNASYPPEWKRFEFTSNAGLSGGRNGPGRGARIEVVVSRGARALPDSKVLKVLSKTAFGAFRGGEP